MRDGAADLYLGDDPGTNTRFKGIVDEFRLYKTTLSQDSIKGLLWFLHGSNNLVMPRGIFYSSNLYAKFNATSYVASSPFAGATVNGNSNTLASNLNSRVIQMVITKNLTLAQAWGILDLARTNTSNAVTSFPFFATSEFYTLGFAWEVSKLVANTSVVNGGNWSMPAPPPNLWRLYWNTIAGWAERVWNAVVAVGAFFAAVGKWLVDAAIGIAYGLATGNWTYFQDKVLKPLADALSKFIQWVINLIEAMVSTVLRPVLDAISAAIAHVQREFATVVNQIFTEHSPSEAERAANAAAKRIDDLFAYLAIFEFIMLLVVFLEGIEAFSKPVSIGIGVLMGILGGFIMGYVVNAMLTETVSYEATDSNNLAGDGRPDIVTGKILSLVPEFPWWAGKGALIMLRLVYALFFRMVAASQHFEVKLPRAAMFAILGLFLWDFSLLIPALHPYGGLVMAIISVVFAVIGSVYSARATAERAVVPITWTASFLLSIGSMAIGTVGLIRAGQRLQNGG